MTARRTYGSYNDGCASAHALDLIGERWALIVARELLLGPKRFVDIQRDVPGVGPSRLSQRLHDLETAGVVTRSVLPPPSGVTVYELTEWGHGLEKVNAALSAWAVQSPALPVDADMSPDTLVLAMRAHARPARRAAQVSLALTDSRDPDRVPVSYLVTVDTDAPAVVTRSNTATGSDARVEATTRAWKTLVIGGRPLAEVDDVLVGGDRAAVRAVIDATRLRV